MVARPDGRQPDQMRPVKITRGVSPYAEGSALIEIGGTKVICTASVEESVPPFMRGQGNGWITAEYGMLPRSSGIRIPRESATGKIKGRTHEIQRLIGRSLRAVADLACLGERQVILDCDVMQADGGTRTASITGAWVALSEAVRWMHGKNMIRRQPILDQVAAISVGIVGGLPVLDLCYEEDSHADVDLNLVMTGSGCFVELQGTAESVAFTDAQLGQMIALGRKGIGELLQLQKEALESS